MWFLRTRRITRLQLLIWRDAVSKPDAMSTTRQQVIPAMITRWRVVLVLTQLLSLLWLFSMRSLADEPPLLVRNQAGELPIILSAPHGGNLPVPDVAVRKGEGLPTGGGGFVTERDTGTEELAQQVADAIERRFGKKPYFVIARTNRKYLDPNRPPEIAYEDDDAKPVYDAYHSALTDYCREVQTKFRKGLLLDIHGQGVAKETVFRGTQNGKTVTLLRERFGEEAHTSDVSLFGLLKSRGWKVHPDPLDDREQPSFRGGYIVQTYGSHQGFGIDAMQLEFGANFRTKAARPKTADTLAKGLVDYAALYLDIPDERSGAKPAQSEPVKPPPKLIAALYEGKGTGGASEKLLNLLERQSNLKIRSVNEQDIREGTLADCRLLIQPGGGGGVQGRALGEEGRQKIREFVAAGGGYVGICAGAYLATCEYEWSLNILDAKIVDRKHWDRGFGTVKLSLTPNGREFFGVDREQLSIYYHQGPLLAPADNPDVPDYDNLAKFETGVSKNGAPPGVMRGCTAIAAGTYHKGRVICFSPHPELTKGQEHLLERAIQWALEKPRND